MTFRRSKSKFGNTRSKCLRGHNHASKLEAQVCNLLLAKEQKGECKLLGVEKPHKLGPLKIGYRADFMLLDLKTNEIYYAEAKSAGTSRTYKWKLIREAWKLYGPSRLDVYGGTHNRVTFWQTIRPVEAPNVA